MASVPADYDTDRGRFGLVGRYGLAGDSHHVVAERLSAERLRPVLDVGCGRGALRHRLGGGAPWVGLVARPRGGWYLTFSTKGQDGQGTRLSRPCSGIIDLILA